MRKIFISLGLVFGLTAVSAFADFEGTLTMKMNLAAPDGTVQGGGTMDMSIAKAGSRMEMNMTAPVPMKMVMLTRTDTPDKVFQINEKSKTYSEMNVAKDQNAPKAAEDNKPWTVKKLGEEKILGYNTKHVLVTHGDQEKMELWTSKDLIDYATYSKLQSARGKLGAEEGMVKALKDADADGMPLKAVVDQGQMKSTIELVKVDKKSLPASMFAVPAGYAKTSGAYPGFGAGVSDPRVDDAKKKMDEALKNMTPEQREMIQKMMKERQGGASQP